MRREAGALLVVLGFIISGCAKGGGPGDSGQGKAAVAGTTVPKAIDAAKAVFKDLGIAEAAAGIAPISEVYGILVGKAGSGSRVQVIANKRDGNIELIVTTDSPADPALREKVLTAVKSRLSP